MARYQLVQTPERVALCDTLDPQTGPVYVDFVHGKAQHRLRFGGGKGQAIAKAIGLHKRPQPLVVDATAGLGRESFVLASLGCTVIMLERHPSVYALLADGLQRLHTCGEADLVLIAQRMQLYQADAAQWLSSQQYTTLPDVVYLDPMFPERRKSAQVQKEMRFFHEIVGDDADSAQLLTCAREHCQYRVVVKRPTHAPQLANSPPAFVIKGKTTRYDVYLPRPT